MLLNPLSFEDRAHYQFIIQFISKAMDYDLNPFSFNLPSIVLLSPSDECLNRAMFTEDDCSYFSYLSSTDPVQVTEQPELKSHKTQEAPKVQETLEKDQLCSWLEKTSQRSTVNQMEVENLIEFGNAFSGNTTQNVQDLEEVISCKNKKNATGKVSSSMRITKRHREKARIISEVRKQGNVDYQVTFQQYCEHINSILAEEIRQSHSEKCLSEAEISKIISGHRSNQTKLIKLLLQFFILAAIDQGHSPNNKLTEVLYVEMQSCCKVQEICAILRNPDHKWFADYMRSFLEPGYLFATIIWRQKEKDAALSILQLQGIPILKVMLEDSRPVSSWNLSKVQTQGNYSQPLDRLSNGTATLSYLKEYTQKEYERCRQAFSNSSCSKQNNTFYFLSRIVIQMLQNMKNQPKGQHLIHEINRMIAKLRNCKTESSIHDSLDEDQIKQYLYETYVKTNKMLEMILKLSNTNALIIKNLVHRYQNLVAIFD